MNDLEVLKEQIISCNKCSRLREWCETREGEKKQYRGMIYWSKPVPGFGDANAEIVIVGLAPGAHGANRTGRPFTGDFAGDLVYQGLYDVGLSNKPVSATRTDGLELRNVYITNAVRCAPPDDRPSTKEFAECSPYLSKELLMLKNLKVIVTLGQRAYDAVKKVYGQGNRLSWGKFEHEKTISLLDGRTHVLCSYHTSQRNVNTGLMDLDKWKEILRRAQSLANLKPESDTFPS